MARLELFGTASCPYTQEMGEWLEWGGCDFVDYGVEQDPAAREPMRIPVHSGRTVPVLVEDDEVVKLGWHGRDVPSSDPPR